MLFQSGEASLKLEIVNYEFSRDGGAQHAPLPTV